MNIEPTVLNFEVVERFNTILCCTEKGSFDKCGTIPSQRIDELGITFSTALHSPLKGRQLVKGPHNAINEILSVSINGTLSKFVVDFVRALGVLLEDFRVLLDQLLLGA